MPIYEFKCHDCGKVSDILSLNPKGKSYLCPECSSSNMEKLVSSSYLIKTNSQLSRQTCCGRQERCETPACSTGERCQRG